MANEGAVVVVVLIAAAAMGVGAYVGGEFAPDLGDDRTETPTPGSGTDDDSPAATTTHEATATAVQTVAPGEFDSSTIALEVAALVNAERRDRDLEELRPFDTLDEMARFHGENMAAQRYASHSAGGYDTEARYERYGLEDRCRVPDDSSTGIRDGRALETVAKTTAGRPYERGDDTYFHRTDEAVARAVVARWGNAPDEREKLLLREATRIGVGVVVAADGGTYVTVDLC